jgi:glycosidase
VKGYRNPAEYFSLFRNSVLVGKESHTWFRNKVVTLFDDHDQVRKGNNKARFCADVGADRLLPVVVGLMAASLGIPCLYYGTEQGFDGNGGNDRYIREAMFGGDFGAFRSRGRHFFNEEHPTYQQLSAILALRKRYLTLRRGRQYLRPISGDGSTFGLPVVVGDQIRSVVPWSRMLSGEELLCAVNTDPAEARAAWVTIDDGLHRVGERFNCVFSTDRTGSPSQVVVEARNGKAVLLTVPAAGFVVYAKP